MAACHSGSRRERNPTGGDKGRSSARSPVRSACSSELSPTAVVPVRSLRRTTNTEANEKVVFFSASVCDVNETGGVLHVLLRTTLGAGCRGYDATVFCTNACHPYPVRRTSAGLQRLAERCAIEMCTQDTPGAPTVRDAIVALGEASTVLAGLKVRGEETVE